MGFEPLTPNTAFAMLTDRDGYWAAKIISAFTDEHLAAICETGKFRDPRAAPYLARVLGERRDKIARWFFARVPPIDFFRVEDGVVRAQDLGIERGCWPAGETSYRSRVYSVNEDRKGDAGEWREGGALEWRLPAGAGPFHAVEVQVSRGDRWSESVIAYVAAASGRLVAVDR